MCLYLVCKEPNVLAILSKDFEQQQIISEGAAEAYRAMKLEHSK